MKHKQTYLLRASFAILAFVMLGYVVKFYPEALTGFDTPLQTAIRGQLPEGLTRFLSTITVLGNPSVQILLVGLTSLGLYLKKWYIESGFMMASGVLAAVIIVGCKHLYQRPRPSISHLVEAGGYSFPSGHSLGSVLIFGSLMIIIAQRVNRKSLRLALQGLLGSLIIIICLSRIYLGVHYPTDVLAGAGLGFGLLNLIYPFYDQKRFEWRFQNKQA